MLFSKYHLWVNEEDGIAKVGISDYAQKKMRTILFLNLPDEGSQFAADDIFGDIESIKTVIDLHIPVGGTIKSINDSLIDEPDAINEDPYDSWFFEIEVTEKSDNLMNEAEYKEYIKTL